MTIHTATSNHHTKRPTSSISANPPRIANYKRLNSSDSDTSSLGMEDPIDSYRQNLKEQGFAELDVPKALQQKIDAVNKILESNQEHHYIDETKILLHYPDRNSNYLTQENRNTIESFENDFKSFTQETLKEIFNGKSVLKSGNIELNINLSTMNNNVFHKDSRINKDMKTNITVTYPMLNQKGTAYIPYDKKNKYPENNTHNENQNYDYEAVDPNEDPNDFYDYKAVDPSDVKNANPNKMFVFLCRKASEDLGSYYDDKSLIHATPEPDDATQARVFMLGRFAVENKNSIQP